jgi:DNA-binding XRE family transcriptional regulator
MDGDQPEVSLAHEPPDSRPCGGLRRMDRRDAHPELEPDAVLDRRARPGRRWTDDPDIREQHEHAALRFGGDLHRIRTRLGWSLEQFSRVSGVDPNSILRIEQGRGDPQLSTMIRLLYPAGFTLQLGLRPGGAEKN